MKRPSNTLEEQAVATGVYFGYSKEEARNGKKLGEPVNTFPCNSGLILNVRGQSEEEFDSVAMAMTISHSLTAHFISNNTYDMLLIRSERNEDTKGLWREQL